MEKKSFAPLEISATYSSPQVSAHLSSFDRTEVPISLSFGTSSFSVGKRYSDNHTDEMENLFETVFLMKRADADAFTAPKRARPPSSNPNCSAACFSESDCSKVKVEDAIPAMTALPVRHDCPENI